MKTGKISAIVFIASLISIIGGYLTISSGFLSISADESTRTLIAYYWFRNGVIESTSWLPLHFIIMGVSFNFLPDLIVMPRIISMISGVLVILVTASVSSLLFKNKTITILTIIMVTLLPQRFLLSLLPLPEIIFIFFIGAGSYWLYKGINTGQFGFIVYTTLLWSFAALLRYEAWLFLTVLSGFIIFEYLKRTITLKKMILLILICSTVPFFWILYSYTISGIWFSFMSVPADIFKENYKSAFPEILAYNPLYHFIEQNILSFNIIGLAGVFLSLKNKITLKWLGVIFIPLLLLSVISLTGSSLPAHNFWRITAVWSIMLVPFSAFAILSIGEQLKIKKQLFLNIIIVLLAVQCSLNSYEIIKNNSDRYTLTAADLKTSETFKQYLSADPYSRVLIESVPNFEHFNIVLGSQEPFKFIYSEKDALVPINKDKYDGVSIDYFLVKSFSRKKDLLRDKKLKLIDEYNGWILFRNNIKESTFLQQ